MTQPAEPVQSTCPACGETDAFPKHVVIGMRLADTTATLPDGSTVPVRVPVDERFHHDCHARFGCHVCQDILAANGGTTKNDAEVATPEHLQVIEPGEFAIDERGVHTRVASKEEATVEREDAEADAGFPVLHAAEANALHAEHAGSLS